MIRQGFPIFAAAAVVLSGGAAAQEETFEEWAADFRARAVDSGRPAELVAEVMDGLEPIELAIELDREQPEFVRPIWEYIDSAVSESRVATCREKVA
ncbi:MAG: lytic murein transglycosylase, partial [Maricaulaceae bacterium]